MKLPHCFSKAFTAQCFPIISAIILCSLLPSHPLQAQVAQDSTLPINSLVTPNGNTFTINGGTTAGTNLFHSFSQFSIPTGSEAFFNNALDIQNIISRVTGSSISNIDGVIRANGTANLFLINPNGIVFGPNASLNIGGSFLGTTANSINFADGSQFSATNPQAQPLLTVSVPVGLGFGSSPGSIRVQGTGHNLTRSGLFSTISGAGTSLTGLRVEPGKTLALVGGDITLEGGILTAPQGQIELGSVESGIVSLNSIPSGWTFDYQGIQNFKDIQLSRQALADASGANESSIHLQGARISLSDGSIVFIQHQGSQTGGSINANASESLEITGTNSAGIIRSGLVNESVGSGGGENIVVSTKRLRLQDGGEINSRSFGTSPTGSIVVNASESVQVIGTSPLNPALSSNLTTTGVSYGQVGNVTISTKQLSLVDGGVVASLTFGSGDGGNVIVKNAKLVEVTGIEPRTFAASSLTASSLSRGNAGNLEIYTEKLIVRDGGRVDASTFASGKAGSVTIFASDVEVSGTAPGSEPGSVIPSQIISSANILDKTLRDIFRLPDQPSANSGDVTINTPRLSVTNGAEVTVKNDGIGNAGTLIVNADSIFLDNKGGITASTASGQGGNITLNVKDSLQLRNNSLISAAANDRYQTGNNITGGNITLNVKDSLQLRNNSLISAEAIDLYQTGKTITGGNIKINAGVIAAIPEENSDITASAPQGSGGRVIINTQGIFGLQVSPQLTSQSDITAFGKTAELNGSVTVKTPEVNVLNALNLRNDNWLNSEQAIAASCLSRRNAKRGTFTITGTGGLPQNPYDPPSGQYAVTNPQALAAPTSQQTSSPTPQPQAFTPKSWKLGDPIQEAQGMTVTADGRLLVGTNPQLNAIVDAQKLVCHEDEIEKSSAH